MNNSYKGSILIVLSAFGYSLLPIFALFAYKGNIEVTTLLLLRFSLTAMILFIYAFIKYKRISIDKKDLLAFFVLGAVCYNFQARFYFSSVKYISASLAAILLYTYPIIVTGLSFLINREKITRKLGLSIGMSFIGLTLILGTSIGKISGYGVLLALGAAFVYSAYILIGNRVVKRTPPFIISAFVAMFSTFGILVTGIFSEGISFRFEPGAWLPITGLVLFSTILAMITFFKGMEMLGPTKASILSMLEPVFTVIFSVILLKDHLTALQMIGGAVVLAGSIMVVWTRGKAL